MSAKRNHHREPTPRPELRCVCGYELKRYWPYCPNCGRAHVWPDSDHLTGWSRQSGRERRHRCRQ